MRYYDVTGLIDKQDIKKVQGIACGGQKNMLIRQYRDYYEGKQWEVSTLMTEKTRSGKKVWKINSTDPRDLGVSEGDLATWNVCNSTVDVYSSYARGSINDQNSISIEGKQELADEINELVNLDVLIPRTVTRMSVDSVACWKFNGETNGLDFVDSLEVTPIYDGEDIVGTVRMYEISKNDPIAEGKVDKRRKEAVIYTEIWIPKKATPDGLTQMWLYKFVNEEQLPSSGKAPYDFNPYIFVANKNSEFKKFDENCLEVSDIEKIIPIQDSINKTATEEGIIISKVAFPMIKIIKEVYEKIMDGTLDGEKVKDDLSKLSIVAGKVIAAPIEVEAGVGVPAGIDTYIENLYNQLYRITGIPKSVYVTEGLGNIASETLSTLMESLKRKVDEKRTNIEKGIKQYITMLTGDPTLEDSVSIQWAEMFSMSKKEMADLIIQGKDLLPKMYSVERLLDINGDADRLDEVIDMLGESDMNFKIEVEKQKITKQLKEETDKQLEAKDKELGKERDLRVKNEIQNSLMAQEIGKVNSALKE